MNDLRDQRKVFEQKIIELRVAHRSEQAMTKFTNMEQSADKEIVRLKAKIEELGDTVIRKVRRVNEQNQ